MNLTHRQKVAMRNPCFEAEETQRRQFSWRGIDPLVSFVLTMNIGLE